MKEIIINQYRFIEYNNSIYVEIFHHKYPQGGLFTTFQECNFSRKKNKFSVIGSISDQFIINKKYRFLLVYPTINRFLEWEQELSIHSTTFSTAQFTIQFQCA